MDYSLPTIDSLSDLASLLETNKKTIQYICRNASSFYKKKEEQKYDANGLVKTDKFGNVLYRTIRESQQPLKEIQRRILDKILNKIPLPRNIKGGVSGENNITNAKYHQGKKYKFATDIKSFYPSISHKHVFKLFSNLFHSRKIASFLTKLTTIEGELPQGVSTSTAIANLVFLPVDNELIHFCESRGIFYTRYIDDLSFSSASCFKEESLNILEIIKSHGFNISNRKTFYTTGKGEFTGLVVSNNCISVPKRHKEKLKEPNISKNRREGLLNYERQIKKTN